jgi:protease-4
MTITPDILYERRKLKSQLKNWKVIALVFLLIALITLNAKFNPSSPSSEYIARISIENVILENSKRTEKIKKIIENKAIKAVIFKVNSPGGTSYGGEQLYNVIRLISGHKPTVAIIGTVAASGGYMVAIASDYILAGKTSITGSIGVIMQSFDARNLLVDKIGITPYSFKSADLKASPSPFEPLTPKIKEAIDSSIQDTFTIFKQMVQERRSLTDAELVAVSDGRVFTGSQAKKMKLIDDFGDEDEAMIWLSEKKNISKKLPIKDYKIDEKAHLLEELVNIKALTTYLLDLLPKTSFLTILN